MKTFCFILFLTLGASGFKEKKDTPSSEQINQLVRKEMSELHIPGMAVAVVQDGKILHLGTYGMANIEWDQKVTESTAFQIASVTKLFTSTLVMRFIQDGKISLEDPVVKYLQDAPESWKDIRIKHLLSHESGIPWPASIGGFLGTRPSTSDKPASKEQVFKDMRDSALVFKAGEKKVISMAMPLFSKWYWKRSEEKTSLKFSQKKFSSH
jgi:CubicO group peptidase (beta-lactamase class C family)